MELRACMPLLPAITLPCAEPAIPLSKLITDLVARSGV